MGLTLCASEEIMTAQGEGALVAKSLSGGRCKLFEGRCQLSEAIGPASDVLDVFASLKSDSKLKIPLLWLRSGLRVGRWQMLVSNSVIAQFRPARISKALGALATNQAHYGDNEEAGRVAMMNGHAENQDSVKGYS